jgi:superoxide dismutase, Cu-Zn family
LSGFQAHATHAIHIHEFGDLRKGCESLGGHYNPYGTVHGRFINREPCKSDENSRHAGDLVNNITANSQGRVILKYFDPLVITPEVIGRSVVIHKGVDDLGLGNNAESLITGNAGARMACAVIGLAGNK